MQQRMLQLLWIWFGWRDANVNVVVKVKFAVAKATIKWADNTTKIMIAATVVETKGQMCVEAKVVVNTS